MVWHLGDKCSDGMTMDRAHDILTLLAYMEWPTTQTYPGQDDIDDDDIRDLRSRHGVSFARGGVGFQAQALEILNAVLCGYGVEHVWAMDDKSLVHTEPDDGSRPVFSYVDHQDNFDDTIGFDVDDTATYGGNAIITTFASWRDDWYDRQNIGERPLTRGEQMARRKSSSRRRAAKKKKTPVEPPVVEEPFRVEVETTPMFELTQDEERLITHMLEMRWYDNRADAIEHIKRMRRNPSRYYIKPGLRGLREHAARFRIMDLPSWGRRVV
jgi:hypothetical protein